MRPKSYRQGDVLLIAVDEPIAPTWRSVPRDQGRIVLARGEATGHAHVIVEESAELFEEPVTQKRRLCLVRPTSFLHEEHRSIDLPPGIFEVRRQREYAPDRLRTVAD